MSIPTLLCDFCGQGFQRYTRLYKRSNKPLFDNNFCSRKCFAASLVTKVLCACQQCSKSFYKLPSQILVSKNNFCSKSCAATYHNAHKTIGIRRSRLEVWLEQQLTSLYPGLEIHYSRKDAINSELDIYVPSLKIAFELNGIFHYEPIFGENKLQQTKNNDQRKFQACLEQGIEFCTLDTSTQKYFKPKTSEKYLTIICNIINQKMVGISEFESE